MAVPTRILLVTIVHLLALTALVAAMPSFESVTSWSSIGNLVPGMSFLEGLGPVSTQGQPGHVPFYMSIAATRGTSARAISSAARHAHRAQETQGT